MNTDSNNQKNHKKETNENNENTETKDKIKKITKNSVKKFYSGNPENEIIEGTIKTLDTRILINDKMDLSYEQLELAKQYIWDFNMDNKYIKSKTLCCTNIKNKFSITEFMQAINTYLSYISIIRVFKSSIPNLYYIYLDFKNVEYSNIFYNTYQYSNINTIEDDYLIFDEVIEIEHENGIKNTNSNSNKKEEEQISTKTKRLRKFSYEYDTNNHGIEDIRICTICLEDINKKNNKKLKNDGLIYVLCGHVFHIECFSGLDDNKCPICRYYLSPYNFVTCEYCFQENDLWLCLVCGKIFCGEEGKSQNHRLQHYKESLHLYTQALGKNRNIIYDFAKNSPVHIWIQNTILNELKNEENNINENNVNINKKETKIENNSDSDLNLEKSSSNEIDSNDKNIICTKSKKNKKNSKEEKNHKKDEDNEEANEKNEDNINNIFKSSKEKTEYIISEYNSIISSQLENQRYYFLNEFKRRENKYLFEKQMLEEEISKAEIELKNLEKEEEKSEFIKKSIFEEVKTRNNKKILLEKDLEKTEDEFKILKKEKNIIETNFMNKNESIDNQIEKVDDEIKELNQQLKELNIHINTLNRVQKSDPEGIKNASLGMIIDFSKKNNTNNKKKKHHH